MTPPKYIQRKYKRYVIQFLTAQRVLMVETNSIRKIARVARRVRAQNWDNFGPTPASYYDRKFQRFEEAA